MKKVLQTILFSLIGLLLLGGAGYWFVQDFLEDDGGEISKVAEEIEQREVSAETTEATEETKTVDKTDADMDEERVQIYLHQMTHQKITADKKRGAVEMSEENIGNMLKIVKENYDHYKHSDFYEKTLLSWQEGDFSNAVSVHNTIWNWHNGTVGRATGLMSAEQEAEYVEKNFR
ncbi:DUF6241 domain-containing protein [Planomicrobium sp. MB-3u-38]|uniref:DUF6241 domain-containing protein n=1 Tax=Planomicrobium sp. MB-3u-38 TaxID=2058318 RepID=UPI000C7A16EF|nr:DUF6241 domain-containing protein [Planomicrobium sp. MB-3u-38]PKH10217.1 hypothetical protein CXF70_10605 [Planomicrobium sp. MB-3u-38]